MLNKAYNILLLVVSIIFVIMMAYAWIMKDLNSLTKVESLLIYGTGTVVLVGWFIVPAFGKKLR